jgi:clan AA aspartic protease
MLVGHLNARRNPFVPLGVAGQTIKAMVDTGFDGGVQLPDFYRVLLNPRQVRTDPYMYPDGTKTNLPVYEVRVTLGTEEFDTEAIFGPPDEVLIGVELLKHLRLTIDFPAGTVELTR